MSVPSDEEIKHIVTNNKFWDSKSLWDLRNELKEEDELFGDLVKGALKSVDTFLNDCVHGNNQYLKLYYNEKTKTVEPNVPENRMALMLHLANSITLLSALFMQILHQHATRKVELDELDLGFASPFIEKMQEYLDSYRDRL